MSQITTTTSTGPTEPTVGSREGRAMIDAAAKARGWEAMDDRPPTDWWAPERPDSYGLRAVDWRADRLRIRSYADTAEIPITAPVADALAAIRRLYPLPDVTDDDVRAALTARGARRRSSCSEVWQIDEDIVARHWLTEWEIFPRTVSSRCDGTLASTAADAISAIHRLLPLPEPSADTREGWTVDDLRADLAAAQASIREATHTLATALDHDTEAALVLETAAEEVVRRWRRDREQLVDAHAALMPATRAPDITTPGDRIRHATRAWKEERAEADRLAALCQEAHDALDAAGVTSGGAPAERIGRLIDQHDIDMRLAEAARGGVVAEHRDRIREMEDDAHQSHVDRIRASEAAERRQERADSLAEVTDLRRRLRDLEVAVVIGAPEIAAALGVSLG